VEVERKKRLDFEDQSQRTKCLLDNFVDRFQLNGQIKAESFMMPDADNMEILKRFLVEEVSTVDGATDVLLATLAQRYIWLMGEVGSLRRTNRHLRSKNARIKKALEGAREAKTPYNEPAVQEQMRLSAKHLIRPERPPIVLVNETGGRVGILKDGVTVKD